MQSGNLVPKITAFHARYGPIVRTAPNELSFIDPSASRDIYAARDGQPRFPKNPVWMGGLIPRGNSIVNASDEDHARIRQVWSHNFTSAALKRQEPLLNHYVNKFMERLRAHEDRARIDIVQWINFLTFDLTGDLAFGESFNCLEGGKFHPWIEVIFSHFKSATLLASIRFYPSVFGALTYLLPASVLRKQQQHFQFAKEKLQRRLNLEQERPDFLQCVVEHQHKSDDCLSEIEIERTAATMIVAGSETTGTCLAGILNHLLKHRDVLEELVHEIRTRYFSEEEIDQDSLVRLPYLRAVMQEGLRIAPPVPTGMPRIVPPGGANVCGHWLSENICVSYAQYAAYHSPLNFHSPDAFLPSRWLAPSNDHLEALQPFSMGPRNCIGQRLALMQVRLVLAKLLWNFDLDTTDGELPAEWAEQKIFTLWEKEPLWIKLRMRTK